MIGTQEIVANLATSVLGLQVREHASPHDVIPVA
jgi:hypothetical protein